MTDARGLALPTGYSDLLGELKGRVRAARTTALRTVNRQLIELYWSIGRTILERQKAESWGSGVMGRLTDDLRAEFREMKGLSRPNLFYMRGFAAAWRDSIVQQPVAQLPWGHVTVLLDKGETPDQRGWYASAALEYGWSRNVLMNMMMNKTSNVPGRRPRTLCKPRWRWIGVRAMTCSLPATASCAYGRTICQNLGSTCLTISNCRSIRPRRGRTRRSPASKSGWRLL